MKKSISAFLVLIIGLFSLSVLFSPLSVLAQTNSAAPSAYCTNVPTTFTGAPPSGDGHATFSSIVKFSVCFLEQSIIPFLFAIAVVVFIYGVVKFIGTQDSSEREQGKQFMLWGIVALAVMFSVWGIVNLLGLTFNVHNVVPQLPVNP